jgi:hypothetical protein
MIERFPHSEAETNRLVEFISLISIRSSL